MYMFCKDLKGIHLVHKKMKLLRIKQEVKMPILYVDVPHLKIYIFIHIMLFYYSCQREIFSSLNIQSDRFKIIYLKVCARKMTYGHNKWFAAAGLHFKFLSTKQIFSNISYLSICYYYLSIYLSIL